MNPRSGELRDAVGVVKQGLYWILLFSSCVNLLMLVVPLYMLQVFDRVLSSFSYDTLLFLSLIAAFAVSSLSILDIVRGHLLIGVGSWILRRLSASTLLASLKAGVVAGTNKGAQPLRNLGTVQSFVSGNDVLPFLDSPWVPVFLLFVFLLHPVLGMIALTGAVILFLVALGNELLTRRYISQSTDTSTQALDDAHVAIRNVDVIEAMGIRADVLSRYETKAITANDQMNRASRISAICSGISKLARLLLQICMLGTGAYLVLQNELTAGGMIAGTILMARALGPVEQSINAWKSAVLARIAFDQLDEHLETYVEDRDSTPLPRPTGKLSLERVTYAYAGQSEPILRGINFELAPGEALGIIGPSTAGKTTLAKIILGIITPQIGNARLDGMDMAKWNSTDRGQYIGYLPQDIELFTGTIRENIARLSDSSPEKVIEAAMTAGCHEMVLRKERAYDTYISEGGTSLSGGERQRIALARAVFGDPQLLVFDEPNSNLDAIGEEALINTIRKLKQAGRSLVVIGHRAGVLQHVDTLLVLRNGQIQDIGPRDEVVETLNRSAEGSNVTDIKKRL